MLETGLTARKPERSAITYAIVASIVMHVLVLAWFPGIVDILKLGRFDPPPIVARLVETHPVVAPGAERDQLLTQDQQNASRPESEPAPLPAVPTVPAKPAARLATPLVHPAMPRAETASIAPPNVLPADTVPGVESARAASVEERAALITPPGTVTHAPAPVVAAPAAEAMDPATLGQYRIALITAARRYKQYPRVAIDNNWEGRADVRLVVDASGAITSLSIKTSSGYKILDQQALQMIRKAKPSATIPPALRGRGFTLDLPVLFSLKEETG